MADTSSTSPWIEIFRAGDYRSQGKAQITRADLERVVRNYDPSFHEAPVVIGHPQSDLPAYAWIDRLALDGDKLLAKEKQVDVKFDELRKSGRFKKRSAAFYQDASGNVTGLRHVGWLGAQPPEVKGLQDVKFEDGGRAFIAMEYGEEESVADENTKTIDERIKAFFSELLPGKKTEAAQFDEAAMQRIVGDAITAATTPLTTKITQLETDLKTQATTFSEREAKISGAEVKQRSIDAVNKLKTAGRWVPAFDVQGLGLVFDELAKTTQTVEFGEGAAKKSITPLDAFVAFMEGLPKIVPVGTTFTGAAVVKTGSVSSDPLTVAAKARAEEKSISFSEALDQVAQENPELTRPGASGAGAV